MNLKSIITELYLIINILEFNISPEGNIVPGFFSHNMNSFQLEELCDVVSEGEDDDCDNISKPVVHPSLHKKLFKSLK